jgi:hypothetical protein
MSIWLLVSYGHPLPFSPSEIHQAEPAKRNGTFPYTTKIIVFIDLLANQPVDERN